MPKGLEFSPRFATLLYGRFRLGGYNMATETLDAPKKTTIVLKDALEAKDHNAVDEIFRGSGPVYFRACAGYALGKTDDANDLVEAAIKNPAHIRSDYFRQNLLDRMAWDAPRKLHPWVHLQRAFAEFEAADYGTAFKTAQWALEQLPIQNRDIRYRLYEVMVESLLRPTSLEAPGVKADLERLMFIHDPMKREPWTAMYRGCIAAHDGDPTEAMFHFQRFASSDLAFSHYAKGAYSFRPDLRGNGAGLIGGMEIVTTPRDERPTFVFCADNRYFALFAPLVIRSLVAHDAAANVHFHIVGEALDLTFDGIDPAWVSSRIGLSVEPDPCLGSAYYASARFIRASELLNAYQVPLTFFDMDGCFTANPDKFVAAVSASPGAISRKVRDDHMPWRSVAADRFAFPNSGLSHDLFTAMRENLLGLFEANREGGGKLWWCDQNAFAIALQAMGTDASALDSIYRIGSRIGGLPFAPAPNASSAKRLFIERHSARLAQMT